MAAAFPELRIWSNSGLTFPWVFATGPTGSISDANLGHGGCAAAEVMLIYFDDLADAAQQLIGYSWRDTSTTPSTLRRIIPFKHPFYTQLYCTRIVKVEGLQPDGVFDDTFGPYETYTLMRLTLQFSRPNYALLADNQILDMDGNPQEWLRYTDRYWYPDVQLYYRESTTFVYTEGTPSSPQQPVPSSVGLPIAKLELTRRWYQLPENAVYTNTGFPSNLIFNFFDGSNMLETLNSTAFLGIRAGCLRYVKPEILPQPLPLPPQLMGLLDTESFQLQYDVVFHFVYFDPPLGSGATTHGHNTLPWADNLWYLAATKQSGQPQFASNTMQNLWQIL